MRILQGLHSSISHKIFMIYSNVLLSTIAHGCPMLIGTGRWVGKWIGKWNDKFLSSLDRMRLLICSEYMDFSYFLS